MGWLVAASLVVSVISGGMGYGAAKKQAQAAKDQAAMQNMLGKLEIDNMREAATAQAEQIRFQAGRMRSTQTAQQATSGIVAGEGSGGIVIDDTIKLSEADVLVTSYNAINGIVATSTASRFAQQSALNRAGAAEMSGYATLLNTGSNVLNTVSSYKALTTPRNNFQPRAQSAPALERSAPVATNIR